MKYPSQDPLNPSFASRSSSSSLTPATISPPNVPSFTTDNQKSWLSQPPLQQRHLPAAAPQSDYLTDYRSSPATDFVLFPTASAHRPARHSAEFVPATHRQALSSALNAASQGPHRRNSTQSASVQNPRVAEIIQGSGHNTSSTSINRFSPHQVQKQSFYASSAPSSTSALPQSQPQQSSSNRPAVPLFPSISTGNVHLQQHHNQHQRNPSNSSTMAQGTIYTADGRGLSPKLNAASTEASLFDMPPADFGHDYVADAPLFESDFTSHFTSVNDPSVAPTSAGTVSPKDIMRDPLASEPPSTSFTDLTSPSIFDSPDVGDSFETSPMFDHGDGNLRVDNWYSLFPGNNCESDESPPNPSVDLYEQPVGVHDGDSRHRSSPGQSPHSSRQSGKHSSISGVNSRKRDKPLPPIAVEDTSDVIAIKRARNTMAARKSRQKKVEKFEELEKTIEELKDEVEHWKSIAMNQHPGQG
ncbi:MAG: hypothetical protein M1825_003513 [Sarcosagium campestre]|nr:MAG: hypothetical protein M1825_003513 [Sarcosagium campestre]